MGAEHKHFVKAECFCFAHACNTIESKRYCSMMNKQSLLIVGPGNAFTNELVDVFSAQDFSIGIIGRNNAKLEEVSNSLTSRHVSHLVRVADVTIETEIEDAIKDMADLMPPWNTIIFNVKDSPRGDVLNIEGNRVMDSLASNVIGAMQVGRVALRTWPRTAEASIILSGGGYKDTPHTEKVGLSIGKAGLHTLGLLMRESYKPYNVAIHEIVIDGEVGSGSIHPRELAEGYLRVAMNMQYTSGSRALAPYVTFQSNHSDITE